MSIVLTDAHVTINGTSDDISEYLKTVTIDASRTDHDDTRMGSGGKIHKTGMVDGSLTLELADDIASGGLDSIIWAIFAAGDNVEVRVRQTSASASSSNPEYRFEVAPTGYSIGGGVDTLAAKSLTWPISGGVERVTS